MPLLVGITKKEKKKHTFPSSFVIPKKQSYVSAAKVSRKVSPRKQNGKIMCQALYCTGLRYHFGRICSMSYTRSALRKFVNFIFVNEPN